MSHFTVLVIGKNPEKQLKPFDENMEVPEYVSGPVTEEEMEDCIKYYVEHKGWKYMNNFSDLYAKYGKDWNGGVWRQHTDGTWQEYSSRNPNSKWDWYQLGGRWRGFFKVKASASLYKVGKPGVFDNEAEDGWADSLLKKDIDFHFMIAEAKEKAGVRYDGAMKFLGNLPVNKTWKEITSEIENIEMARTHYWNQERCQAWTLEASKNDKSIATPHSDPDEFIFSRDEYIKIAGQNAFTTFAIVKDGQWHEKGKMGWFATVSDKKDDWAQEFVELIKDVSDDALFSLYDCHI